MGNLQRVQLAESEVSNVEQYLEPTEQPLEQLDEDSAEEFVEEKPYDYYDCIV